MSSNTNNDDDLEGADIWGDGEETKTDPAAPSADAQGNANDGNNEAKDDGGGGEEEDVISDDMLAMSNSELRQRISMIDNEVRMMKSDLQRIRHESQGQQERIKENIEKVKVNKQLPYLVGNVVEILEPEAEDGAFVSS
jgi:26S proteasome regulatory subunit T5